MTEPMTVTYIPYPGSVEPRYSAFVEAVTVDVRIQLADDPGDYVRAVRESTVVVEDGGLIGDVDAIRAAAESDVRVWQVTTTGVDHVDVSLFRELGLPLAHVPSRFTAPAVAEHAIFLMLGVARQYKVAVANLAAQVFYEPVGAELAGKTVGLIGFGGTGREVSVRARALGMDVIAVEADERQVAEGLRLTGVEAQGIDALPQLLAESDFVSVHVPLLDATRDMIGQAELAAMKPSAFLINTARGAIVNRDALYDALVNGVIAGAGIDVFSESPVDPDEPLLHLPNVIATPHIAGITQESSQRFAAVAAENVARIHAGQPPTHLLA